MNLRHLLFLLIPLALAAAVGSGVYFTYEALQPNPMGARGAPTRLYGRRVPGFRLPGLVGEGINSVDLINSRKPVLLVFWASWSPPSMQQHPVLLALKDDGVTIWGITYRDKRNAAADFLDRNTNPFARVANDEPGRAALDFGVDSVPETFLVDGEGFVRWHMTGPLTPEMVRSHILPLYRKYSD